LAGIGLGKSLGFAHGPTNQCHYPYLFAVDIEPVGMAFFGHTTYLVDERQKALSAVWLLIIDERHWLGLIE
jgi:hypothetical protein